MISRAVGYGESTPILLVVRALLFVKMFVHINVYLGEPDKDVELFYENVTIH
jgi:hypothetical protein